MTLLFMDGFEGYAYEDLDKFWDIVNITEYGVIEIDSVGRNGGNALYQNSYDPSGGYLLKWINPNPITDGLVTVGFAIKMIEISNGRPIFSMDDGSDAGNSYFPVQIIVENSKFVLYKSPSYTEIAVYSSPVFDLNTWYYLEVKLRVHATLGSIEFRINEESVYSNNAMDTRSYLSQYDHVGRVVFRMGNYMRTMLDDIYIVNDQGTFNNDFLGDIRIDAVHPNGAGNYTQFTPSAGANYECVDDASFDDTDYVSHLTVGEKDSYTYANVPTDIDDAGIFGVQLSNLGKRTAGSDNIKIKGLLRTGAADYEEATAQSLADEFKIRNVIWEKDPSDSNIWTQAKINACEFGMEVN